MAGNGNNAPLFISVENGDMRHIMNVNCINFIQVSSINGELRSASVTLNDSKNVVTIIGSNSVAQLLEFLKPHVKVEIQSKK